MEGTLHTLKRRKEDLLPEIVTSPHLHDMIDDAILIARYCLESGLLNQGQILERLLIIQNLANGNKLTDKDIGEVIHHFDQLSLLAGNVTANSLRETSDVNESYWRSRTGRHLLALWLITGAIGVLIFLYSMLEYRVSYYDISPGEAFGDPHLFWVRLQHYATFLVPFTYGALGACAFLLRNMAGSLRSRQFDVANIPQNWNRLILGALSGGLIVMFINQFPGTGNTSVVQISEGALGFLAGYSIDFLFNSLDRIINAILPSKGSDSDDNNSNTNKDKTTKLVKRYNDQLNKSNDANEKKVLENVIRDLK